MRHPNRRGLRASPEPSTAASATVPILDAERHRVLRRLEWAMTRVWEQLSTRGPGALTGPQLEALRLLMKAGPASVGTVSRAIGVGFSSTTGVIDRLEQLHLVARDRSEQDRRTVTVTMTEEGGRVLEEILEDRVAALNRVFHALEIQDLWTLYALLQQASRLDPTIQVS